MDATALLSFLAIILYLAVGFGLALGYFHANRGILAISTVGAVFALVVHGVEIWMVMDTPAGWDVNFLNTLSLSAWAIGLVLLVTGVWARTIEAGIIIFPGTALCLALQWLTGIEPLLLGELSTVLEAHVVTSLLAYSLLGIAAIHALMLAFQDYALRHPRPIRQLEMLPPLAVIETVMFRLIAVGWIVLTASLVTGLTYLENLFAQHLAHKTFLSLLSWVLFGLLLGGRWWYGWRGRRAVHWTLAAMAVLLLAYFGSKLVLEVFLDRSWMMPPEP
ncbi:MAG: cytochrome C assembly family protein [Wenzhouxiangella sp.]